MEFEIQMNFKIQIKQTAKVQEDWEILNTVI